MKSKLLVVLVLLASALLVYFALPVAPDVSVEPVATDAAHEGHEYHEADPSPSIALVNLAIPLMDSFAMAL